MGLEITLSAFGKVNLLLDVGKTRPDGFHEVSMLMQEVGISDEVSIVSSESREITLTCDIPQLSGQKNIAWRAASLLQEKFGLPGVDIRIRKRIPLEAGMGGGSTDAAAVIDGMNELFRLGLSLAEKEELGARLGSDIPFFFSGGTCFCTGRGEIVEKFPDLPEIAIVLLKPNFGISTPWAYHMFDEETAHPPVDPAVVRKAVEEGDVRKVGALMQNHLEKAALLTYPVLSQMKEDLLKDGAFASMMTGSGPTVFGLFEGETEAASAAEELEKKYPGPCRVIRTCTHKKGAPRAIFHEYRN